MSVVRNVVTVLALVVGLFIGVTIAAKPSTSPPPRPVATSRFVATATRLAREVEATCPSGLIAVDVETHAPDASLSTRTSCAETTGINPFVPVGAAR